MKIRPVKQDEYDQLLGLMRQLNPLDPEASEIESQVFTEIIDSNYLELFVAEADGVLLGSCYINVIPNITRGGRPYAVIENVVTDSAHRKQGIGRSLLAHSLDYAWSKHCYKVMLLTGRLNEDTFRFYESAGFDRHAKQAFIAKP